MDHEADIVRVTSSFDAFVHRNETRELGALVRRGSGPRKTTARAKSYATAGMALAALAVVAGILGLLVQSIGTIGLVIALGFMLVAILFLVFGSGASSKPIAPYRQEMSNQAVMQRLGALLSRHRTQLPPRAGQRVGAIAAQLPLLEQQLSVLDPLDPLAQDARRLAGQHLPELIERYERVPAQYRGERDGDGLSVDDRLVVGLDAARTAIDDLGRQLSRQSVDDFQTQGRFLESRYRENELGSGA